VTIWWQAAQGAQERGRGWTRGSCNIEVVWQVDTRINKRYSHQGRTDAILRWEEAREWARQGSGDRGIIDSIQYPEPAISGQAYSLFPLVYTLSKQCQPRTTSQDPPPSSIMAKFLRQRGFFVFFFSSSFSFPSLSFRVVVVFLGSQVEDSLFSVSSVCAEPLSCISSLSLFLGRYGPRQCRSVRSSSSSGCSQPLLKVQPCKFRPPVELGPTSRRPLHSGDLINKN
jgi:hypothetical protein